YPLSYLLLTLFVIVLLGPRGPATAGPYVRNDGPASGGPSFGAARWATLVFIASLSFVNREDTILLYLPALAWVMLGRLRLMRGPDALRLVVATAPAWGWLLSALVYYGFPFPNTYYAKVAFGVPHWVQLRQGFAYVASSLRFDPITLATIAAAAGVVLA